MQMRKTVWNFGARIIGKKLGASNSMFLISCCLPQLERKGVSYGIGKKHIEENPFAT